MLLRGLVLQRFERSLLGFDGLHLVEVLGPDRRVGKNRDEMRLHLEEAALDEDDLVLLLSGDLDADRARLDLRKQRRVARVDAELALDAGKDDELGVARE